MDATFSRDDFSRALYAVENGAETFPHEIVVAALRLAEAASGPDGHRWLAPMEPDEAMLWAGQLALAYSGVDNDGIVEVWRAMRDLHMGLDEPETSAVKTDEPAGIGDRIRSLRLRADFTQAAVAKALSVTRGAVCNWERGQGVKVEHLTRLGLFFGVSVDWLLTGRIGFNDACPT